MKLNNLTKSLIVLALSSILLLISSCKEEKKEIIPTEITFKKEGELVIHSSGIVSFF